MDRLEAMSLLLAAADGGSLSAAGRRLDVPVSTVSRRISELEAHLRARLVVRSPRRLTLTDAGLAYVRACRRIMEQIEEAERAASGEYTTPTGDLVVTSPYVFGRVHMLPAVGEFLALYPDINVRLVLSDRNVDILGDQIDLALRIGELPDSGLIATRLGAVRRIVCGSPDFFARWGQPRVPADVADMPCVTLDSLDPRPVWRFALPGTGQIQAVALRPRLAVNTSEAAVEAAVRGIGLARIYQSVIIPRQAELVTVLEEFEEPPAPIHLLHTTRDLLPLKTRVFLNFIAPRFRRLLGGE